MESEAGLGLTTIILKGAAIGGRRGPPHHSPYPAETRSLSGHPRAIWPGRTKPDHPPGSHRAEHPLAAHLDALSHHPGIGQRDVVPGCRPSGWRARRAAPPAGGRAHPRSGWPPAAAGRARRRSAPPAAPCIWRRSSSSLPLIFTVRTRLPRSGAPRSAGDLLVAARGDDALAPIVGARPRTPPLPKAPVAPVHRDGLSRLRLARRVTAYRAISRPRPRAPAACYRRDAPSGDGISVGTRIRSASAGRRESRNSAGDMRARGLAVSPLQDDVGRLRVVARGHRGIAGTPSRPRRQLRRVGADLSHAADAAGARDHRRFQQITALAAPTLRRHRREPLVAATSTITSPVPSTGSGTVSTTRGEPKSLRELLLSWTPLVAEDHGYRR